MRARAVAACGVLLMLAVVAAPAVFGARQQAPAVTGATFFAVQVRDVEAMGEWYRAVLGLSQVNRIDAEDGSYAIRILSGGGLTIELIQQRGTTRPAETTQGLFKAGFYVADIEAFHRHLVDRGVDADERVFTDEALGARSFVFRDPEGNRLQVFERVG